MLPLPTSVSPWLHPALSRGTGTAFPGAFFSADSQVMENRKLSFAVGFLLLTCLQLWGCNLCGLVMGEQ